MTFHSLASKSSSLLLLLLSQHCQIIYKISFVFSITMKNWGRKIYMMQSRWGMTLTEDIVTTEWYWKFKHKLLRFESQKRFRHRRFGHSSSLSCMKYFLHFNVTLYVLIFGISLNCCALIEYHNTQLIPPPHLLERFLTPNPRSRYFF